MTPEVAAAQADASDVRLEGVTKVFGETVAVEEMTLTVRQGEFFSLLGPSGCGKTTTLRLVAGFEEPTAGTIRIGERDIGGLPPYRRPVNTVFQSYALFPHLTVWDNVAFGLRRAGHDRATIKTRVGEMLAKVGLADRAEAKPRQLSGGQQQRVALARALVNLPAVLLLDEPLGALDLKLRKELQLELKHIQHEVGITFLYVTHDQEEALTMSDRIAVMNRGVVEQCDVPEAIYERPETPFVAGFIGVSNLLAGIVEQVRGEIADVRLEGGVRLRAPAPPGIGPGAAVQVCVRPEKIHLHDEDKAPGSDHARVAGTVRDVVYLGTTTQYRVGLDGGGELTVLAQNAQVASGATIYRPGERAVLGWAPEHNRVLVGAPPGDQDQTDLEEDRA